MAFTTKFGEEPTMKTVKFGKLEVGKIHRIVAVVHRKAELSRLPELAKEIDILELRADQLYKEGREVCEQALEKMREMRLPIIVTVREGEGQKFKDAERLELFRNLIPEVQAIDIELRTKIRDEVIKIAKNAGKAIIVSEHDFKETPPDSKLEEMLSLSRSCGADITKIATYGNSLEDVSRLIRFALNTSKECPVVCISLGEKGQISRVIAPIIGSCLSYGYIEKPVAPGQSSVLSLNKELKKYISELH